MRTNSMDINGASIAILLLNISVGESFGDTNRVFWFLPHVLLPVLDIVLSIGMEDLATGFVVHGGKLLKGSVDVVENLVVSLIVCKQVI